MNGLKNIKKTTPTLTKLNIRININWRWYCWIVSLIYQWHSLFLFFMNFRLGIFFFLLFKQNCSSLDIFFFLKKTCNCFSCHNSMINVFFYYFSIFFSYIWIVHLFKKKKAELGYPKCNCWWYSKIERLILQHRMLLNWKTDENCLYYFFFVRLFNNNSPVYFVYFFFVVCLSNFPLNFELFIETCDENCLIFSQFSFSRRKTLE